MRLPLVLLALLTLAATAPRDWSATVIARPDGAWVIGNPAARVKLVEWASYTCPHCAHFAEQSEAVLDRQMIRSGSTSLEVRHFVMNAPDFAAVLAARCGGPRGFARRHHAIFATQAAWASKAGAYMQANADSLNAAPKPVAFRRIADAAGLTAIARAGLGEAQLAQCFSAAAVERAGALGTPPPEVNSTPSFYLNGRLFAGADWAILQPALRAAGAK